MNVPTDRSKAGYTLIELIIVAGIIGVLSSIVLASINEIRQNSRDAKRIADLENIALALGLYKEENGEFPNGAGYDGGGVGQATEGRICSGCTGPINVDLLEYLGEIPEDPLHDGLTYGYYYDPAHSCETQSTKAALYAIRMENVSNDNQGDLICVDQDSSGFAMDGEGRNGNTLSTYTIILGNTP